MKKLLLISPKIKQQLKHYQIVTPNSKNHIFDILAGRGSEYSINLPKSKYNKLGISEMTFDDFFQNRRSVFVGNTDLVWVIDYDESQFPKLSETYIINYMIKQLSKVMPPPPKPRTIRVRKI